MSHFDLGDTILFVTGGSSEQRTEAISLDKSSLVCPDLPDFPRELIYGSIFKNGDVPVVCGGDLFQTSCYQLMQDVDGSWTWNFFADSLRERYSSGYSQIGDEYWMAGGT